MTRFSLLSLITAAVAAGAAAPALAQTAAAPAAQRYPVIYNIGVVSDYRYRGISQTRLQPALQGGIDYAMGPFYVGAWASTIQWVKDGGGNSSVEIDLYGGYKAELVKDLTLEMGALTYQYPNNKLNPNANTTEVFAALTTGPFTAKYSHTTSNLFGLGRAKLGSTGSGYLDLSATFSVGGFGITPHVGRQTVKNFDANSYTDYSVTVSKALSGVTYSAMLVGADTRAYIGPAGQNLGKTSVVLTAKLSF